jgi:hypothetical protein
MTLAHSDSGRPNMPTTMSLGDTPRVFSAAADPAARLKRDRSTRPAGPDLHRRRAAGIRRLDHLANIIARHTPIGVLDQPPQPQSP